MQEKMQKLMQNVIVQTGKWTYGDLQESCEESEKWQKYIKT